MLAEDFLDGKQGESGLGSATDFLDSGQKKKQNSGILGDIGTGLKRGVEQMPGMVTGLADIVAAPVSAATGINRPVSRAADWLGEKAGFQPEKWAKQAESEYSPEMQQSLKNVQDADGFFPTLKAVAENPRAAVNLVSESLPSTLAGGILAKGAMGAVAGAEKLAAMKAAGDTAGLLKAGTIAGGIGEGIVTAGQQMSQTDYNVDPLRAAGSAIAAGGITGAIGAGSGRLASSAIGRKLGLTDIEASIAAGALGQNAAKAGPMAYAKRIGAGAVQEGLLEEAPQSYSEQVWQNIANGKPWNEGAAEAAAQGAVAGGVMGGGINALPRSAVPPQREPATDTAEQTPAQDKPSVTPDNLFKHATDRLSEIERKATGTPDQTVQGPDGKPMVVPGDLPQFLTHEEKAERDFLNSNIGNQDALAAGYGVKVAAEQPAKLPDTGPVSRAVNVGIETGATSITQQPIQQGAEAQFQRLAELELAAEQRPLTPAETAEANRIQSALDQEGNSEPAPAAGPSPQASESNPAADKLAPFMASRSDAQLANLAGPGHRPAVNESARAEIARRAASAPAAPAVPAEQPAADPVMAGKTDKQLQNLSGAGHSTATRRAAGAEITRRSGVLESIASQVTAPAQQSSTSPLQQSATALTLPGGIARAAQPVEMATQEKQANAAQVGPVAATAQGASQAINQLRREVESADPFSERSADAIDRLTSAVTDDAKSSIASGQMPVYRVTDKLAVTISPSAQNPGKFQVTRYSSDGVLGDSQYNSIEDAISQEGLAHKPRMSSQEADSFLGSSVSAESNYQQRRENSSQGGKSGIAKGAAGIAQRQANAANNFVDSVQEQFGLSKEDAGRAWDHFVKNKLVKIDTVGGQYSLTDGRLWDGDVMRKAASAVNADRPSKSIRRGEVGGKMEAGEVVTTASGRQTTPFPKVNMANNLAASRTPKQVDRWLMDNALAEAEARGDEFNARQFGANAQKPSQADKDSAEEYLFGQQPEVLKSILKPLAAEKQAEPSADAAPKPKKSGISIVQSGGTSPIAKRDDLVGAIIRVTGGNGIHPKMSQTIVGDKANAATKVRGLFTLRGQEDLDDIAELLRIQENYDVRDGNHLAELVRQQAGGDPVYSMERVERDAVANVEKEYRDRIRKSAKKFGIKTVARPFNGIEQEVLRTLERRHNEAVAKLDARAKSRFDAMLKHAIDVADYDEIDAIVADAQNRFFGRQFWTEATKQLRGYIDDLTIERQAQENTNNATDQEETPSSEPDWLRDAGPEGVGSRGAVDRVDQATPPGLGEEAEQDFNLAAQTNEQAAEQFAQQQAAKEKGAADKKAADDKAKADSEANDFRLSGSDRAADVAVSGGQQDIFAQPVKATTEAKAVEPWQMTRDEFFDQGDAPVRNALISSGLGKIELQGYRTTYEYESPAPSGPFKGVTVTRSQQPVGSIIGMPFGRAVVKTSTKLKGGQAILDRGELFELGKEYHKRVVADAIADGKPVPANVLADYPDLKPKSVEPAAQSAEQKIRSAFDSLPSVSLGVAYPITVEHNGVKREFMVRQDALGRGKIPALHVVAIHQGRMIASDEKSWIAQSYKLNWKNELTEEGLPKKISDQEADEFKANFKGNPAAVDAKKEAETKPSEMDALKAEMGQAIGELASILGVKQNLTPEEESRIIPVMSKIFRIAAKMGYIKFKDAAKYVLGQIRQLAGNDVADKISIDNLQAGYINIAKEIGGDKREAMSYDSIEDLEKADATDQRSSTDLERDSRDARPQDGLGEEGVRAGRDGNGGTGRPGVQGGESSVRSGRGGELRGHEAAAAGERGDLEIYTGAPELSPGAAGNRVDLGSRDSGIAGPPVEPDATKAIGEAATKQSELVANKAEQAHADKTVAHKGGIAAIRDALPILTEGQQEDVAKAETRFAVPDGYGMLFTNGTGTGKTFTGLGVIKRLANQGKTNILVVAPNDKIIEDWQKAGKLLGLDISRLADTNDAGRGIVITTHANMGQNNALASREWDLVVSDEAHYLAMGKDGANTNALKALRAITLHPDGVHHRHSMLNAADIERLKQLDESAKSDRMSDFDVLWHQAEVTQKEADKLRNELRAKQEAIKADVAERQGEKRPRALFLSATPFAYEKTVDWANGYLFDYNEGRSNDQREFRGYNEGSNLDQFMMQHFGYRMRYGKLTQPDAKVDSGLMQRQFNTWLKKKGSLSGRMLDVAADYDRRFILVDSAIGQRIDDALEWFESKRKVQRAEAMEAGERIGRADPYESALSAVRDQIGEKFDYLSRRYLLESIKAREVVPHVREHLAMGRKVVVFHDYKKGGGFNPFLLEERTVKEQEATDATIQADQWNRVVREFNAEFRDIINSDLFRQSSPIDMFKDEFPGVLLFNGDVPAKTRRDNVAKFQDDASGPQVILVQSAAGKEGISLHDTTGKHQRVLFNLGQPTQPTTAIQQEGRIYRTGQVTDAIFRYLNTGTNWEKWAFATTIAQRASAAENLGMGEQARALKDAFISGFEESADYRAGMEDEGKGGKARDKAANDALTEYDRARAFYFGTQKKNSKTKAQEGADYFATPEPVGLKMVEWADIRPGEKVLEPSAGHGAIARWIPDSAEKTAIEPSMTLRPRLAMVFDGQIIGSDFESLNVVNKYDAIVMNPPFGSGGKTAVDHIAKAATHLRDGGRIVALLPTGPAADKKFDKWMYEGETRQMKPLYTHPELGPIYENDTLTMNAFGSDLKIAGPLVIDVSGSGPRFVRPKGESKNTAVNLVALKSIAPGNRTEIYRPAEGIYMVADIKMPAVTFERAGTQVMTRIVVLEKQTDTTRAPNGGNKIDLSDIDDINELFKRVEYVGFQNRPKVDAQEAGQAPANDRPQKAKPAAVGDVVTVNGNEYAIEIYTTNDGKEKRGIWMEEKEAKEINPRAFKSSKMRGTPAEGKFFVDEYWLNKKGARPSIGEPAAGLAKSDLIPQIAKSLNSQSLARALVEGGLVTGVNGQAELDRIVAANNGARYMVAWHGSPHNHDKFDSSKIGTGEGAQAYGYGFYFAGAKDVAEWYRDKLSNSDEKIATVMRILNDESKQTVDSLKKHGRKIANDAPDKNTVNDLSVARAIMALERISEKIKTINASRAYYGKERLAIDDILDYVENGEKRGRLYQVELAPSEDQYLDWDRSLSEQSDTVKQNLSAAVSWMASRDGFTDGAKEQIANGYVKGGSFYKWLAGELSLVDATDNPEKSASEYLHSIGIRGIRYLDGSSRNKGEGNSNYVIFSDEDVTITAKYSKEQQTLGATLPDGRIILNLDALNADNFDGVFQHEGWHSSVRELIGQETYDKLLRQLSNATKLARNNEWVKQAEARAIEAGTHASAMADEIGGYAIEAYANGEKLPNVIARWVQSFLSTLRTALIKSKHVPVNLKMWAMKNVQPQDLARLAVAGLKAKARSMQDQAQGYGREAVAYSKQSLPNTITVDGIERPTKNSNGKPIYPTEEGIRNFWKWFGDSKVVDSDGRPLVVYHGTASDVDVFDKAKIGTGADGRRGQVVGDHGKGFYFINSTHMASWFALQNRNGSNVIPAYLKIASGKDGKAVKEGGITQYVVYEPENIKSATGNTGAFSPTNPDIRYSQSSVQSSNGLPNKPSVSRAINGAELKRLRGIAARLEAAERGITFRVTEDGQAIVTGPARIAIPARFERFAKNHGLTFKVERGSTGMLPSGKPIATRLGENMPVQYRESGALYHQEMGDNADRTGRTRFSKGPASGSTPSQPPVQPPNQWQSAKQQFANLTSPDSINTLIYNFQNKYIDLKNLQARIKQIGGTLTDLNDAYLGEEMYHGKVMKKTGDFLEMEIRPLLQQLLNNGIKKEEFETFLHARHAPEANRVLAERNPTQAMIDAGKQAVETSLKALQVQLQKAQAQGTATKAIEQAIEQAQAEKAKWAGAQAFHGTEAERASLSGMSDAAAAQIMATLSAGKRKDMNAAAAKVDAIQAKTLAELEKYGLMDKASLDAWRKEYQHYIPLHRDEAHPDSTSHPIGQGFSVKGDASKRRTGSNEKVTNILGHIAMQREAAITRGEKNSVSKRLYLLAAQNPDKDFWSVDRPPMLKTIDQRTGFVRSQVDPMYKNKPNVLMVRIAGKDAAIVFNEHNPEAARLAGALKNLDGQDLDIVERTIGKATRWFAAVNTQYNPIFGVINLLRDSQSGILNLTSTALGDKKGAVAKGIPAALKAIYQAGRGITPSNAGMAALWREFQTVGGQTGYRDLFASPEDRGKALEKELKALERGPLSQRLHAMADWLSDYNMVMENGVRLSAYKVALDQGMSKERAASLAKNLTVNFNRKGAKAAKLGAFYAFFNASVQGTERLAKTMAGPAGRKILMGGIALGVLQQVLGVMMMGGDDDEWEKIPDFVKERSLIFPIGGGYFVSIPMPLGFNVLPNIGRLFAEWAMGGKDKPTGAQIGKLMNVVLSSFNPVGGNDLVDTISPTVSDPVVSLLRNKDWTGRPIYREDMASLDPTPGFTRTKDSATPWAKGMSYVVNMATGGTDYTPGRWSPTPDQIDYVIGQITGGIGRELGKAAQTGAAITGLSNDELPIHKVPLAGRLIGSTAGTPGQSGRFYENVRELNGIEREIKGLVKDGKDVSDYVNSEPLTGLVGYGNQAESRVKMLREQRRLLSNAGDSTGAREIDGMIADTMKGLNTEMRSARR